MKTKIRVLCCLLGLCCCFYGQQADFKYKRDLTGVTDAWHKIVVPEEMYGSIQSDLSDLRVFDITADKDTLEIPYILDKNLSNLKKNRLNFYLLNTSYDASNSYYTFQQETPVVIDYMRLEFEQDNFDWKVKLEGSQDNKEWMTIVDDYRILSLENGLESFEFTELHFPSSQYTYYKLTVYDTPDADLVKAEIVKATEAQEDLINYNVDSFRVLQNTRDRLTEVFVDLNYPVPVREIQFNVPVDYDYYRPLTIEYLTDSVQTQKGWHYNYHTLTSGILNSMDDHNFRFEDVIAQKFKITIKNQENQPLPIKGVEMRGAAYELLARFNQPTKVALVYGNSQVSAPHYDIENFKDKIPENLSALDVGDEETWSIEAAEDQPSIFASKWWLWAIMLIVVALLGWFSIKMLQAEK